MLQLGSMEEDIADAELSLRAYLESLGAEGTHSDGFSGYGTLLKQHLHLHLPITCNCLSPRMPCSQSQGCTS